MRRLQHVREVRGAARPGAPPVRLRGGRDRPLRAPRRSARTGGRGCCRARDADKDQTYFLYGLRQDQLDHARFPLGELTKPEVRAVARGLGLATADKPESQEICFVPGGDYRDALRERAGWTPEPGPLLDVDGERVGEHGGHGRVHGRPAPGARRRARRAALRQPDRPADQHDHAGPARGPRDDGPCDLERATFVAGDAPAGRDRSAPSVRIRHRDADRRSPATVVSRARDALLDRRDRHAGLGRCARSGGGALRRRRSSSAAAGSPVRRSLAASASERWIRRAREHRPGASCVLVGIFDVALYVLIRGSAGGRLPLLAAAAILGAWAGDTLGDRLGITILSIGDFRLLVALIGSWAGIALVSVLAVLGPFERKA